MLLVVVFVFSAGACSVVAVSFGACFSGGSSSGVGGKILLRCIKMLVNYRTGQEMKMLHSISHILRKWGNLRHPLVVGFYILGIEQAENHSL